MADLGLSNRHAAKLRGLNTLPMSALRRHDPAGWQEFGRATPVRAPG
jgi:hypothetical protein